MDNLTPQPHGWPGWSERQRRRRRVNSVAIAGMIVLAVVGLLIERPWTPHRPPAATPAAQVPAASDALPSDPSPSPAYEDCGPGDLDPQPRYVAASGVAFPLGYPVDLATLPGEHVVIRNGGRRTCALRVAPVLRYTDGARQVRTLDAGSAMGLTGGPDQPLVVLAPGGYAQLVVLNLDLDPSRPADPLQLCPTTTDYQGMSVVLAGGRPYPLPGLRLSQMCPHITVTPWLPLDDPGSLPHG